MPTTIDRVAQARSFVRSLNILLKFARLYGFEHTHTAAQFAAAWTELRNAIPPGDETGLLLGASGSQLLVNGSALEGVPAERSFAKLLSTAGIASIQFLPAVTQDDLARLVQAFPSSNTSSQLAEQLKTAVAATAGIRLNEVRFVAEDGATSEIRNAAALTAQALGADAGQFKALLSDPQKLLQLIAAAEGSRGDAGALGGKGCSGGSAAPGTATPPPGQGGSAPPNTSFSAGTSASGSAATGTGRSGTGGGAIAPGDEEALTVLRLLARIGQSSGSGSAEATGLFQQELAKLPQQSRSVLQDALATLAARTPNASANEPMLLRLAENLAIRFALERYERGEVRVNAVREMLDRMSQEITGLRKVLGSHEEKLAQAGVNVESQADVLDRQFWAGVPESGKRSVLTSPDAYCVPPRNIRQYVQELLARGDQATATAILDNYSASISHEDPSVRRRVAIGLSELAELYGSDTAALEPAIGRVGLQLSAERETELQALISAAFVRLTQEATFRRRYHAVLQALDSLDGIENQRPAFAQSVRPRLGLEQRLPDFLDEAVRTAPEYTASLMDLIARMAHPAAAEMVKRFNRSSQCNERERIAEVTNTIGPEVQSYLREMLQHGQPADAAETAGILLRLDAPAVEKRLQGRLAGWPRTAQDRAMRLIAASGAPERGALLLSLFDQFDPMLQPLTIDEIGMSGDAHAVERLSRIASAAESSDFLRLKAVEALGRLHATDAEGLLREIVESRKLWHWQYPGELRLAALLALRNIAPAWAITFYGPNGFTADDVGLGPSDASSDQTWSRQRRHLRVRLKSILPATAASETETIVLQVRSLSLSGGLASGDRHISPGTLVTLRLGGGLRPIRAKAFMRGARAQALSFEFADMDLEDRGRLRRLLRENGPTGSDSGSATIPQAKT